MTRIAIVSACALLLAPLVATSSASAQSIVDVWAKLGADPDHPPTVSCAVLHPAAGAEGACQALTSGQKKAHIAVNSEGGTPSDILVTFDGAGGATSYLCDALLVCVGPVQTRGLVNFAVG